MPASSGGDSNISNWFHIAVMVGGGIGLKDWYDLNEYEQEALLQEANHHAEQSNKASKAATEDLTKKISSMQESNQPSPFSRMHSPFV